MVAGPAAGFCLGLKAIARERKRFVAWWNSLGERA
jgi:hypothetical protein